MLTLDIAWSLPSRYAVSGVHHKYRTAPARPEQVAEYVELYSLTDVKQMWWGMLEPQGFIVPHIDAGPWYRRFHYPIVSAGFVWHNGVTLESPTDPFEIVHYEPHAVWNDSDVDRVHLLVETNETVGPVDITSLVLCPMIPEIQELVDDT